jgi:trans-aconitate methyltransferase
VSAPPPANFDSLARIYAWLERASFGGALQRTRTAHLDALARLGASPRVLLVGDGDGRFLAALLARHPAARVQSIDASAAMLARAAARVPPADRARVTFAHGDIRARDWTPAAFDAVVTAFVLDCFTLEEASAVIARVTPAVRAGGLWLWSDFAIPARGVRRAAAQLMTGALYRFFRWRTRISARELPPAESLLAHAGWRPVSVTGHLGGLARSAVFERV